MGAYKTSGHRRSDRKSTRLNSSHMSISYAVFCLKKKNALEVVRAPTDPDVLKGSGTAQQANATTLVTQYLNALGGLNNAQTKMYDIWLSLYATRMQLYLDLDRLPLDLRGVWVDELSYLPKGTAAAVGAPSDVAEAQA